MRPINVFPHAPRSHSPYKADFSNGFRSISTPKSRPRSPLSKEHSRSPYTPDLPDSLSPSNKLTNVSSKVDCGLKTRREGGAQGGRGQSSEGWAGRDHRENRDKSAYDSLLSRLIAHYTSLSSSHYSGEIALLSSLHGSLDAQNISALSFLPSLPPALKAEIQAQTASKPPQTRLSSAESSLFSAISLLTPRTIGALRGISHPSASLYRVCVAFLRLFSKVDVGIEVSPGFQLVRSRAWETWQEYVKRPGHVVQMARKVGEFVRTGTIGEGEIKDVKSLLTDGPSPHPSPRPPWSEAEDLLYSYLESVESYYSIYTHEHPPPPQPSYSTPRSHQSRPFSAFSPSNRPPSLSPTPRKRSIGLKIPTVSHIDTENRPPISPKPSHKESVTDLTIEWEFELALRRVLQRKLIISSEELLGLDSEELQGQDWARFPSLWPALQPDLLRIRERYEAQIGEKRYEEAVNRLKTKLKQSDFMRKSFTKAVIKAKVELERQNRQRIGQYCYV